MVALAAKEEAVRVVARVAAAAPVARKAVGWVGQTAAREQR